MAGRYVFKTKTVALRHLKQMSYYLWVYGVELFLRLKLTGHEFGCKVPVVMICMGILYELYGAK